MNDAMLAHMFGDSREERDIPVITTKQGSENDLIRRGDALAAAKGFIGAETAIRALPATDAREAALREVVKELVEALREIWAMCADHANDPDHYLVRGWVEVSARAALAKLEGKK